MRNLIIVLGDQLDLNAAAFDEFDVEQDAVWMAEVSAESENVWSSKSRTTLFLSGMRHFAQSLRQIGRCVHYVCLDDAQNCGTLDGELSRFVAKFQPLRLIMTAPGDWRVWTSLKAVARRCRIRLEVRPDRHFYTSVGDFSVYERGLKGRPMRLESFYRELRRRFNALMSDDRPESEVWNFDKFNRRAFDGEGPGLMPGPLRFEADAITRDVIELVERRFGDHPGELTSFGWAVTRNQALHALKDFIDYRLPMFGRYQDAMWAGEPWLYHS
jgi:deoxyribodipyrimidine photolyase-related protein